MKKVILIVFLLASITSFSQIILPATFKYVNKNSEGGDYYADGKLTINRACYKCDYGENIHEPFVESYYPQAVKTKDNLFIQQIHNTDWTRYFYYYTIIIPEDKSAIQLISKTKNKHFTDMCKWMLKQVRAKRASGNVYLDLKSRN